jgi:hypothetical protein
MPEPTLIEEALPGPGDRDMHGRCWWGHGIVHDPQTGEPYHPTWSLAEEPYGCDTHWLPAGDLPVAHPWILSDDDEPADDDGREALTAAERNPSLAIR